MGKIVENGSNWGEGALTSDESHSEFLELCALATSGSLNEEEEKRLIEHLAQCRSCRQVMAQYEAIVGKVLPVLGEEDFHTKFEDDPSSWSPEDAEASLFARIDGESYHSKGVKSGNQREIATNHSPPEDDPLVNDHVLWRHLWWQYAASLILLAALGFAVYRTGIRHGKEFAVASLHVVPASPSVPPSVSAPPSSSLQASTSDSVIDKQLAILRARVEQQAAAIAQLKKEEAETANDRDAVRVANLQLAGERNALTQQLHATQASLHDVQQKLDASVNQTAANTTERISLEAQLGQLSNTLHARELELTRRQDLLDHDRDIRELMGARNLYIAEVYDVAKTGDTEKPFGRVFYTKGKSLIFYAYDLDQQTGVKNVGNFQAWGRRGPDTGHAVKLGILFQDDANKKRWVMKTRDPKTLNDIDAVFVTVEPNGESSHPSGKPFLFAYLHNDPNHP